MAGKGDAQGEADKTSAQDDDVVAFHALYLGPDAGNGKTAPQRTSRNQTMCTQPAGSATVPR